MPSSKSSDADEARNDLACALRAAAHHGLSEGVCNHFSLAVPGRPGEFFINPQGLHWSELGPDDLVTIDEKGRRIAGKNEVEPTAFFIHGMPSIRCEKRQTPLPLVKSACSE